MLTHGLARSDRLVTDHLRGRSALLEEFPLLDDPAVAMDLDRLLLQLSLRVPRAPLYGNGVASAALQDDLITDLRLREGFRDGPFDVFTPNLTRPVAGLEPHEIGRILLGVVAVGIAPVIQEFPDNARVRIAGRRRRTRRDFRRLAGRRPRRLESGDSAEMASTRSEGWVRFLASARISSSVFGLARAIAANIEPSEARLAPGLLAKSLRSGNGDFGPSPRMRDLESGYAPPGCCRSGS